MKKRYLTSLILNVIFGLILLSIAFGVREQILRGLMLRKSKHLPVRIVMLGDSHTKNGKWNSLLGRLDVFNAGTGGYTSEDALGLINYYARPFRPRLCFILTGANDTNKQCYSPENTLRIYQRMADSLRKGHIIPVFQTPFYSLYNAQHNTQIDSINTRLRAYCQAQKIDLIDLKAVLCRDHKLRQELQEDGTHLNAKGYQAWAEVLRTYLASHNL